MNVDEVGPEIRILRCAMGLRQADLAQLVGLSRTSIVNIERCNQNTTLLMLDRIAEAMGYRVEIQFIRKDSHV